jgi:phage-related protein (TIGR01555 family)
MQELLTGRDGENIRRRVQYFSQNRDNDGVMTIDKEAEAISDISTPIGGVTEIVRQQMEIVAAMFGEPAVKLWGISPGGFNATGESDMKNHYDHIHALQERIFREPLEYVLRLLQLNKKGAVDNALSFEFIPLSDEDQDLKARVNKTTADTYATLIDRGVITGAEARLALANDPESGFANIDADEEVDLPDMALPLEGANETDT